jgi:hypothetical protein
MADTFHILIIVAFPLATVAVRAQALINAGTIENGTA